MKVFVILAFCLAVTSAAPQSKATTMRDLVSRYGSRIIGGTEAARGQFPWQAAIEFLTPSGSFFCGGSLISDQWILTAAHCTVDGIYFNVRLGKTNLNTVESGEVSITGSGIAHESYNPNTLNNDIGLIKLDSPVGLTEFIQPVPMAQAGNRVGVDEPVTVSGHGLTHDGGSVSNILYSVNLNTMSNDECADYYGARVIVDSTLCVRTDNSHATCSGDSGGPLVSYANGAAQHVGLVSFGSSAGCEVGAPSGFIRTESFLGWINQHTGL